MRSDYEERKAERIERYEDLANNAQTNANDLHAQARRMADVIPFGQPILVGHHSEKGDRRYRDKIHNKFGKAFAEQDKAKYYAGRAASAENNTAIASDDPAAVVKLKERIAELEGEQTLMREANKAIRKGDDTRLRELGLSDGKIARLKEKDFCGRIGFADYMLTNNSGNIRRLKQRLALLQAEAQESTIEEEIGAVRLVNSVEDNRTQLFFPGKPPEAFREQLKSAGFRWCPTVGCWQRHKSSGALYHARELAAKWCQPAESEVV